MYLYLWYFKEFIFFLLFWIYIMLLVMLHFNKYISKGLIKRNSFTNNSFSTKISCLYIILVKYTVAICKSISHHVISVLSKLQMVYISRVKRECANRFGIWKHSLAVNYGDRNRTSKILTDKTFSWIFFLFAHSSNIMGRILLLLFVLIR